MNIKPRFVDSFTLPCNPNEDPDHIYVFCECSKSINFVIQIDRPEDSQYISFECPDCGKKLGIFAKGINDYLKEEEYNAKS